jgi:hypothetical protein
MSKNTAAVDYASRFKNTWQNNTPFVNGVFSFEILNYIKNEAFVAATFSFKNNEKAFHFRF